MLKKIESETIPDEELRKIEESRPWEGISTEWLENPDLSDLLPLYLRDSSRYHILDASEERDLAKIIVNPQKSPLEKAAARERVIGGILPFVISFAMANLGRGLPLSDLIQEGNVGLCTAVDKFDVTTGFRVLTFAYYHIKRSINQAIYKQARAIRLPDSAINYLAQSRRIENEIFITRGELPSEEDYRERLTGNTATVTAKTKRLIDRAVKSKYSSLDALVETDDSGESRSTHELVGDGKESIEEIVHDKITLDEFQVALSSLIKKVASENEAQVIRQRYYESEDSTPVTQDVVAPLLGIAPQRISQIENPFLIKLLRNIASDSRLLDLFEDTYPQFVDKMYKVLDTIDGFEQNGIKINNRKSRYKYWGPKQFLNKGEKILAELQTYNIAKIIT